MFYDYFRKEERFIDETCKNTGDCLDEPRIPLRGIVEPFSTSKLLPLIEYHAGTHGLSGGRMIADTPRRIIDNFAEANPG